MSTLDLVPDIIKSQLNKIAESDANLLITGESGTGKDELAKLIHTLSNRRDSTPIFINLASIPEDLLERELFGSKAGSFTDSKEDFRGKIELADNSTLILDEISGISLQTQSKLLQIIDRKEITPIGAYKSIKVNCRIIALTKFPLENLIRQGKFREDLYYRINVLNLKIPPLRERITEFKSLVEYILKELDKTNYTLTNDSLLKLLNYNWPGNLRELKNCLERAITLAPSSKITCEYLLLSSNNTCNITRVTLKDAVNNFKKNYILKVLESNDWNITKSAQVLDVQRTYLSKLVKELYNK